MSKAIMIIQLVNVYGKIAIEPSANKQGKIGDILTYEGLSIFDLEKESGSSDSIDGDKNAVEILGNIAFEISFKDTGHLPLQLLL